MSFLTPAFLAGLAALAIPIVIHLVYRERKAVVEFPSLMFLRKVSYRSVRRQKLRRLLLLALRCLALALMVLAFTRPFSRRTTPLAATQGAGGRELIIVLDRSYSMRMGTRWDRAQRAAREALASVQGTERASIVAFAGDAVQLSEPIADRSRLARVVDAVKLVDEMTRLPPALKLAGRIAENSPAGAVDVVLISDFHATAWRRHEELSLPARARLETVDVAKGEQADVAVREVTMARASAAGAVTAQARIANIGGAPSQVSARVEIGGRSAAAPAVTIAPRTTAVITFPAVTVSSRESRGVVRIRARGDSLDTDDSRWFVAAPERELRTLIIQPAVARSSQSLYASRALEIAKHPAFAVSVRDAAAVTAQDVATASFIILNEAAPSPAMARWIRAAVADGSGLLVATGAAGSRGWPSEIRSLLSASTSTLVDRTGNPGSLAAVDYASPIFEQFRGRRAGDFGAARILQYMRLAPADSSAIIARFDDGSPALVERSFGRGTVLTWASSLDATWTDLPLQPVWLPFIHEVARRAGSLREGAGSVTSGDVIDVDRVLGGAASGDVIVQSPSGIITRIARGQPRTLALREAGIHEVRTESTPVGSGRLVAVNVDLDEADLSHVAPSEITAAVAKAPAAGASGGEPETAEEAERRQRAWWYLLVIALALFAAESLLSNRLSRGRVEGVA